MYNYEWDIETGGYILLPSKITGVTKEVRPVFSEELRFLGLDRDYGWDFPDCEGPLMWAEARRYFYKGELVCEASGGGLYEMPTLKNVIKDLRITPVDIEMMLSKNESVMDGLVQKTLKTTYKAYLDYKSRVSMFYVAYSGGKDSIVMLDIVQRALPHDGFVVVFGDTTMELKTTYQALSEAKAHWPSLEWYEARAEFEAEESWRRIGFPARKLRWCCSVHKTAPSIVKLKEIYKTKYPEAQRPFIQPIKKLAEIAHRNGAFFHTDAVQAIGHIPIDVNELNVDLLSASAHKFNGPKGIGFLYVREGTPILPLLNGGAQENSLRAGTENVASIVGMATALSMNCSQIQKSQNHSAKMVELICSILNDAEVDYIRNGYSNGLKGTLNLSFRGKDGEAILHRLDLRGILVSTGSACDSNSVQVSHVIKAINVPDSYAKGTIRISLGKDNTIEEAKIIGETLVSVLMEQK